MVDKDLLAVRYTKYNIAKNSYYDTTNKLNIAKNNITNAAVLGSLGVEELKEKTFDLIVSNIPAKIGDEAIAKEFIQEPYRLLNPNGEYWIVVVSALNRLIPQVCNMNNIKVKEIRKRKGHTVYKISKLVSEN